MISLILTYKTHSNDYHIVQYLIITTNKQTQIKEKKKENLLIRTIYYIIVLF